MRNFYSTKVASHLRSSPPPPHTPTLTFTMRPTKRSTAASFLMLLTLLHLLSPVASFSTHPPLLTNSPSTTSRWAECSFNSFDFDPLTGICRRPSSFHYDPLPPTDEGQYFVLRNVPGDGDCVFHAVLSSVYISMGMLNPDYTTTTSSNMLSSMVYEMRNVVANFLSSPEGTLYVSNKPHGKRRLVRCTDLLTSAANGEAMSREEYLQKLRMPGRKGGLYGGGPELTVLSNVLRRPISIYHLSQSTTTEVDTTTNDGDGGDMNRRLCKIDRVGVFGEGLFEDPCSSIPNSVISNAVFFTLDGRTKKQQALQSTTKASQMVELGTSTSPQSTSVNGTIDTISTAREETIPNTSNGFSSISSPMKCSWHLHILIADSRNNEKHACVLLPSVPILHNTQ